MRMELCLFSPWSYSDHPIACFTCQLRSSCCKLTCRLATTSYWRSLGTLTFFHDSKLQPQPRENIHTQTEQVLRMNCMNPLGYLSGCRTPHWQKTPAPQAPTTQVPPAHVATVTKSARPSPTLVAPDDRRSRREKLPSNTRLNPCE